MYTVLLDSIFKGALPEAVFRTLLHSLWLGVLLAALAGLVILFTRKSGPHIRYQLFTFLLVVFFIGELFLFYKTIDGYTQASEYTDLKIQSATILNVVASDEKSEALNLYSSIKTFITDHSSWFVVLWLMVICFRSLQLLLGFREMGRLKNQQLTDVGAFWNGKMERLIVAIGMSRPVLMYKSAAAAAPMVIGFFKPVILFPAAVFNALSTNEIEAIILHELAHIRRNDFAVNMGQRFLEIIFFFNPAVLWVSELIRREREYCCDDLAVTAINSKEQYVHALVAFQEFQLQSQLKFATAFPGSKNQILQRVNRIISNNNKSLNTMEKFILASAIVITAAATVAFSQHRKPGKTADTAINSIELNAKKHEKSASGETSIKEVPISLEKSSRDTTPENISVKHSMISEYSVDYKGKKYEIVKKEGKVLSLKVNGKEIPADEISRYKPETDSINAMIERSSLKLEKDMLNLSEDKARKLFEEQAIMSEKLALQHSLESNLFEKQLQLNNHLNELQPKLLEDFNEANALAKVNLELALNQKQQELTMLQLKEKLQPGMLQLKGKNDLVFNEQQLELLQKELKNNLQLHQDFALDQQELLLKNYEVEKLLNKQAQEDFFKSQKYNLQLQESLVKSQEDLTDIVDLLYEKGVIKDRQNFKMKLTNNELLINGKKQPAELHKQILNKYQKKPEDKVNFEYNITH